MIRFLRRPSYRHDTCPDARSECTHRAYGLKLHRLSTIERPVPAHRPRDRSSQRFFVKPFLVWDAKILTKSIFFDKKGAKFMIILSYNSNTQKRGEA